MSSDCMLGSSSSSSSGERGKKWSGEVIQPP
jgi:hypothetical protein